jgi:hypothetical protein
MTSESTVLEKLFQEDQPIGGNGIATGVASSSCEDFDITPVTACAELYVQPQSNNKTADFTAVEEMRLTSTVHIIRK